MIIVCIDYKMLLEVTCVLFCISINHVVFFYWMLAVLFDLQLCYFQIDKFEINKRI